MKLFTLTIVIILTAVVACIGQTAPPDTAQKGNENGIAFLRAGKFAEALAEFEAVARSNPKSSAAQGNIGSALMGLERPAEAANAFREAIKLAPTVGSFHTALCNALVASEKFDEAIKACEEGVRLDPNSDNSHASLVNALSLAERRDVDINRLVSTALSRFRDSVPILDAAASYYSLVGNYQAAAELWELLTQLRPSVARYHGRLAVTLLKLEREAEAVIAARKALELEPNNPYANYSMGRLFLELGQHADAAEAFKRAMTEKRIRKDAQVYLAVSESNLGHPALAIEIFKEALRNNPNDQRILSAYGEALNHASRYEEAVVPLRKAVALDRTDFETKAALGLALFESAQFPEAIAVLEETERMKPGNEIIAMFLRVSRARQEGIPRIDEMKRYAKENPGDIGVRVDLIQTLAFARRIDEVEPYVQEVLALRPKEVRVYQTIAVAYSTAGKRDKALAIYQKSLAVKEDPGTYLGFAGFYRDEGKVEEASGAYEKVLTLKPDSPGIMKLYADHLRDNGKRREALEMYKRSLALKPTDGPTLSSAAAVAARLGEMETARQYLATLKVVDPAIARALEQYLFLLRSWQ